MNHKPTILRLQDYIEAAIRYGKPLELVPHRCPVCDGETYYGIAVPLGWEHECPNHEAHADPETGALVPEQHIQVVPVRDVEVAAA